MKKNISDTDYMIREGIRGALIELRKEKGLRQDELAEIVGKKRTTIGAWEDGTSLPSLEMLYRLSKYYNVTLERMYGIKEGSDYADRKKDTIWKI